MRNATQPSVAHACGDRHFDNNFYENFWADRDYSEKYAAYHALNFRYPAIEIVWGDRQRPNRVLDFGCGNGVLTQVLSRRGFADEIIGVDISETGIAAATESARKNNCPAVSFKVIANPIELRSLGAFDLIVSSHVLEHLYEPVTTLKDLFASAPYVFIEIPLEHCLSQSIKHFLLRRSRMDNPLGHVNFWSKKSFQKLLASEGISIVGEFQYAPAVRETKVNLAKKWVQILTLKALGVNGYGRIFGTHLAVLVRNTASRNLTKLD